MGSGKEVGRDTTVAIITLYKEGYKNEDIATCVGIGVRQVQKWTKKYKYKYVNELLIIYYLQHHTISIHVYVLLEAAIQTETNVTGRTVEICVTLLLPLVSAGGATDMSSSIGFWLCWHWRNGFTEVPFNQSSFNGVCLLPVGWWPRRRFMVCLELQHELACQFDAQLLQGLLDSYELLYKV